MPVQIAAAPVSYGVFEITADRDDLPSGEALASAMAEAGYVGTELGPPGFFGADGHDVGTLLKAHGLALVGSFLPLRFSREEGFREDLASLDETLRLLDDASAQAGRPMVLLCDAFCEPERMQHAGAIEQHPETWLDAKRQALLVANTQRAAERCRELGFEVSFHYHAGTYVETPREIAAFVEAIDHSLLGLCFDTGHTAFGGGDPLATLREYGELVNHVHLKDVDLALLARLHGEHRGLADAWAEGVFCELGTGGGRCDDCLSELRTSGYDGWIVVEQDRVLGPAMTFPGALESAKRNRAFLRDRGW